MYQFNREEYEKRMQWFVNARFGMFIHWGLYAIPARGEWVRSFEEIPKEDYMKYFDEFDPVDYDEEMGESRKRGRYAVCGSDCKTPRRFLPV